MLAFPMFVVFLLSATAGASPPSGEAMRGYVLGRYASADDRPVVAGRYFAQALAADQQNPDLTRRAFEIAVAVGDKPRAVQLARQLTTSGAGSSDTALVLLADAVTRRDWTAANTAKAGIASAGYATVIEPIARAWMLFAQGEVPQALARLEPAPFTGFARSYVAEQRAHMLAADRQYLSAAAAYADLRAGSSFALLRLGEADALAQAGDPAAAQLLLIGNDPAIAAARQRLTAGRRIGALAPDARHGLGWTMARLATDLSRETPDDSAGDLALVFARTATFLAPDNAAVWLVLADVLASQNRHGEALTALGEVRMGDPLAAAAAMRRAETLEAMGRNADAGVLLAAAATAPGAGADTWARLGDWHRRADRFDDAIAAYTRAIAVAETGAQVGEGASAGAGAGASWGLYFLRGSMKERAGDWAAAEADLLLALEKSPEEPVVLNYLGYSQLDRGIGGDVPAALIARAARLRPGDGGIVDSLGWSQFKRGSFGEAVTTLERAAALEPTDPTIADHLGDAYWQAGRRIEARFRWRAALALDPDARLNKALASKIAVGLDAAQALAAAPS